MIRINPRSDITYSWDCQKILNLAGKINDRLPLKEYRRKVKEVFSKTLDFLAGINLDDPRQAFFARRIRAFLTSGLTPDRIQKFCSRVKKLDLAKISLHGKFKEQAVHSRVNGSMNISLASSQIEFLRCYAENPRFICKEQVDALMQWGMQNWDPVIIKRLLKHRRFSAEILDQLIQTAVDCSRSPREASLRLKSIASPLMLHHFNRLSEGGKKRICERLELEPAPDHQNYPSIDDGRASSLIPQGREMDFEADLYAGFFTTSSEQTKFEQEIRSLLRFDEPGTFDSHLDPDKMRALPESLRSELLEWADENEDVDLIQFLIQHDLITSKLLNSMVESCLDLGLFKDIAAVMTQDKIDALSPDIRERALAWKNSKPD